MAFKREHQAGTAHPTVRWLIRLPSRQPLSNRSGKRAPTFEYPRLTRFCTTSQELHEKYGLSLSGKLSSHISDNGLLDSQWPSVFTSYHTKGSKIFLSMVCPEFLDECRLLYHKLHQGIPPNNELTTKFVNLFTFEKCEAAKEDPKGHQITLRSHG